MQDLLPHAVERLVAMERAGVEVNVPLAVFDVAVDLGGQRPLEVPSDPEAGRLVVVALHPLLREDLLGALAEIERREVPLARSRLALPGFGLNTPLKRVFNEMVALPATAVTFTLRDKDGEANLIALVRTAFTIAELREQAGLTQQQLAKLLKTSQLQVSRLESPGYEGHSLSMLRRVAAALKARVRVTLEPLAGGGGQLVAGAKR